MRACQFSLVGMATLGLGSFILLGPASPQQDPILEAGKFSAAEAGGGLPAGWKPLTFKNIDKHTVYSLVKDGDAIVVKAESQASASGLIRDIKIDPREFPILQWRWKVGNIMKKGDVRRKEGDDYPARIYITFEYDPEKLSFSDRVKFGLVKALRRRMHIRPDNVAPPSLKPRDAKSDDRNADGLVAVFVEAYSPGHRPTCEEARACG